MHFEETNQPKIDLEIIKKKPSVLLPPKATPTSFNNGLPSLVEDSGHAQFTCVCVSSKSEGSYTNR